MTYRTIFKCFPKIIQSLFLKVRDLLMYNSLLRFAILTYYTSFYAAVHTVFITKEQIVISLMIMLCLVSFLIIQGVFLKRNRQNLHKKEISNRFNSLYKDIDVEKPGYLHLLHTTLHCVRRIITSLVAVLLTDNFFLQMVTVLVLNQLYIVWLYQANPMNQVTLNRLNLFNEYVMLLLCDMMLGFSDAVKSTLDVYNLGTIFNLTLVVLIAVNFGLLLHGIISLVVSKVKHKFAKRKSKVKDTK